MSAPASKAHASPGEVVLAAPLYPLVEEQHPGGRPDRVVVRGREQPVDIVVLATGASGRESGRTEATRTRAAGQRPGGHCHGALAILGP